MEDGLLTKVGQFDKAELEDCDLVVDAKGVTACPGLIDSHVHIAFGDYAPRFATTGFLKDYLYGGTTTAISASEVHVPGRPSDVEGVKALAVAAKKCWDNVRPAGMRVYGGNVLLEPGLTDEDFQELAGHGIWLAKAGFGSVKTPFDYVPLIQAAKRAGMITNVHTGGASLSLANSIYQQVKAGNDKTWCTLAKKYAKDASGQNCGKATFTKGQTVPVFDKVAFSQPTKTVHAPIYDPVQYKSWFVVEPLGPVKPRRSTPEKQVASSIKQQLLQQKKNQKMTDWVTQTSKDFCSGSKIKYQTGYKPIPDPCATATATTNATTTG